MNEFTDLATPADWSAKLDAMLIEAEHATEGRDDAARLALAARLRQFVNASPSSSPMTSSLDSIALDAAALLGESVIDDAIERIAERTGTLVALRTQLHDISP